MPEAVKSFLDQDWPNKELIIVNDHEGYPLELDKDYPEVKIFNFDKRFISLGAKRNAAKSLVTGDYVFIWEDDDLNTPWRMSASIKLLEENQEYDAVNSKIAITSTDNTINGVSGNNFEGATCFRRSFLDKHEYRDDMNVTMDLEMQKHAHLLRVDPGPLYWYVYRWGLGVWHLSGSGSDCNENWNNGLVHCRTDLGTTIVPQYFQNHWSIITGWMKLNRPTEFEQWYEAIRKYLLEEPRTMG